MKKVSFLAFALLVSFGLQAQTLVEKPIVNTTFRDWRALEYVSDKADAPDSTRQLVTKNSKETITFTFHQTNLYEGGKGKVSATCAAPDKYMCAMKTASDPATVTTSAFASVTTLSFLERVTGGSRGWGVKVKGDGDEDWVTVYSTTIGSGEKTIDVAVNRTNVQIQWYNLSVGNYAALTSLVIKGMVEDDGTVALTYFDLNGQYMGEQTVTSGSGFAPQYKAEDLNVPEGMVFRGWYENSAKVREGDIITNDMNLYALATAKEQALTGTHYLYDFRPASFYPEDHDLLVYENAQKIGVLVSPKAYVLYTTSDGTAHKDYYEGQEKVLVTCEAPLTIATIEVYNVAAPVEKVGQRYNLTGGDVASFLMVVSQLQNGDTIYFANGTYDLGEIALTTIARNNVVLLGESMEGVIIRNTPSIDIEGISTTATILNTGNGNKYENLTLQNAMDYYASLAKTNNGRGVCLQDKGDKTVCYRVRMLSYQDTYYSNKIGAQKYFEECEIHGTVDFICGDGSVYFYNCLLYCEPRKSTGGGSDALTASNADANDKGYVFDRCTVQSKCPVVSLGRSWNNAPQCAFLLTTFDYSAGNFSVTDDGIKRWTTAAMNHLPEFFGEYKTMNVAGEVISPQENNVTFTYEQSTKEMNTIISYERAKEMTYPNFFKNWDPAVNYVPFPEDPTALTTPFGAATDSKIIKDGHLYIRQSANSYVNAVGF
ncbi:MAG: pectinesterase family protein [Paludibacteraceae bacterium]|nr:pectinesterase family protein [Paludibacteraceae bacterium]